MGAFSTWPSLFAHSVKVYSIWKCFIALYHSPELEPWCEGRLIQTLNGRLQNWIRELETDPGASKFFQRGLPNGPGSFQTDPGASKKRLRGLPKQANRIREVLGTDPGASKKDSGVFQNGSGSSQNQQGSSKLSSGSSKTSRGLPN